MPSFIPRFILGSLELTEAPYAVEFGSQFGAPENVTDVLNSLLADGELLSSTRSSNRQLEVTVLVEGADLQELAAAEAALVLEANKPRNTLTFDPGDGIGVRTVFDTFQAAMTLDRDDNGEQALVRRFSLSIPALPYARSESLTTETAEGIPSVGTIIASGAATTNWSTPTPTISPVPSPMLSVVSSRLLVQPWRGKKTAYNDNTGSYYNYDYSATLTQVISTTSGAYISFEVELEVPATFVYSADLIGGTTITSIVVTSSQHGTQTIPVSQMVVETLAARRLRYTWRVSEVLTISSIQWQATQYRSRANPDQPYPFMYISNVAVAATPSFGKQAIKTIDVGGSARTTGAIHVAAPSDAVALGEIVAFTTPQDKVAVGFRPDLRMWVAPGATTSATNSPPSGQAFTGITTTYGAAGSPVLTMPASLFVGGGHTIAILARHATAPSFDVSVETALIVGGTVVATEELTATVLQATAELGMWRHRILGTMYLPTAGILSPTTNATVRFRFKSATSNVAVDEIFAFPTDGDLSIVDAGTGTVGATASSHVWIDSPSADQPQGGYWRGATPTRADAISAWSSTTVPGVHTFDAGQMLAFVSSTVAQGPTVSFDYSKRWLFHAAE